MKQRERQGETNTNKDKTISMFTDVGGEAEGQSDQKHVENSRGRQSSEKSKVFQRISLDRKVVSHHVKLSSSSFFFKFYLIT